MILRTLTLVFALILSQSSFSQDKAMSLDELVKQVKKERLLEKQELLERVEKFESARDKQSVVLNEAKTKYINEEARSKRLRSRYEENEVAIKTQENILKQRVGSLDELHGVVRQIANEVDSIIDTSIVSAQKPGRDEGIDKLAASKELPSIKELEGLWLLALDEMAESAKIVSFPANIILNTGEEVEQTVTRVGVFNTFSNGHYLRFLPETGKLVEPGRQPTARFQTMASDLENADHNQLSPGQSSDLYPIALDPTRGEMLALLVQEPNTFERIEQGGLIGFIIIVVGIIGLLIAIIRLVSLTLTNKKVQTQLADKTPDDNPLGRIMQVYVKNPDIDTETLEFKMDEAILKELPGLQRGMSILSLLAAIAPLLGLLGTVTGIIETFQSITLFGTGDPRTMSSGISQALVTTVMGLVVAIPLLLLHSFISSKSNNMIQILDEKSKGFIAQLAETNRRKQSNA